MVRLELVALVALASACASPPQRTPAAPPRPSAAPDDLGSIVPVPYETPRIEHTDPRILALIDAGDYVGCGTAYAAQHDELPDATGADALLFRAAACFERAGAIGATVTAQRALIQRHPKSPLAPDALLGSIRAYTQLALFEDAATACEQYATRFPARGDAPALLTRAITLRLGLGNRAKALADAETFARHYGHSLPDLSAQAHLQVVAALDGDPARLIAHLDQFELRYQRTARVGLRMAAAVRRGRARWHGACPVDTIERGVCARLEEPLRWIDGCTKPHESLWRVVPRDTVAVKRAQADFRRAIAMWQAAPKGTRDMGASYWGAAAEFHLAEAELEAFLAIDLDLSGAEDQLDARFDTFVEQSRAAQRRLQTSYARVLSYDHGALYWGVAAEARVAQSQLRFIDLLLATDMPQAWFDDLDADQRVEAYCDEVLEEIEPVEANVVHGLESCTRLAAASGWYDSWTRWCQDELSAQQPTQHPPLDEWFADPSASAAATHLPDLSKIPAADRANALALAKRQLSEVLATRPDDVMGPAAMALLMVLPDPDAGDDTNDRTTPVLAQLIIDAAVERQPNSAPLINARGVIAARRGQLGLAYSSFREAELIDSHFMPAFLNAGSAALRLRKLDQAVPHFQDAVELAPTNYDARIGLGVALRMAGDAQGAERAYRAALTLDGSRPEALFNLGLLELAASKRVAAFDSPPLLEAVITRFQQAIALPATRPDQQQILQRRIDELRKTIEIIEQAKAKYPPKPKP